MERSIQTCPHWSSTSSFGYEPPPWQTSRFIPIWYDNLRSFSTSIEKFHFPLKPWHKLYVSSYATLNLTNQNTIKACNAMSSASKEQELKIVHHFFWSGSTFLQFKLNKLYILHEHHCHCSALFWRTIWGQIWRIIFFPKWPRMRSKDSTNTSGVYSHLYFAHTCIRDLFIAGVIYLAKKIIWWWYFTCKHVSLF